MKRYLIAGALVFAFVTPALAADYYVALRLGGGAAACEVMTTPPDAKTHKMMGKYEFRGRRDGGHGHHERVRWLGQQNTRSYRGLNRSRWFGDKAPASALIR